MPLGRAVFSSVPIGSVTLPYREPRIGDISILKCVCVYVCTHKREVNMCYHSEEDFIQEHNRGGSDDPGTGTVIPLAIRRSVNLLLIVTLVYNSLSKSLGPFV